MSWAQLRSPRLAGCVPCEWILLIARFGSQPSSFPPPSMRCASGCAHPFATSANGVGHPRAIFSTYAGGENVWATRRNNTRASIALIKGRTIRLRMIIGSRFFEAACAHAAVLDRKCPRPPHHPESLGGLLGHIRQVFAELEQTPPGGPRTRLRRLQRPERRIGDLRARRRGAPVS